jgi:hypothetical protein
MRKRVVSFERPYAPGQPWLDLDRAASVEVTSEDKAHPIESALLSGKEGGWRAAQPGRQTIRLIFDEPQRLRRIWLEFEETETTRTQEFVLRWSTGDEHCLQEIVRQQWNFSPPGTTLETEDYTVELPGARVLEMIVLPDISGGETHASLKHWRVSGQ